MDLGTVQSSRTIPPDSNETALEDHEILRRLVRLLSKSEEDELCAQDVRREPSINSVRALERSKSEGNSTSIHLNRSRSILRLPETAPLRISRVPKVDLAETWKILERSSLKLRAKLRHSQNAFRSTRKGSAFPKIAAKLSVHLENVTNYMKQQMDILSQADTGPPSEVYARNLSSALSSLAQSVRTLARVISELRDDELIDDMEDLEPFERLAQLAESEARSIKESRADDALKRMSGVRFRAHSAELSTQLCEACDNVSACLSDAVRSLISALNERRDREGYKHLLRTGIAILFSVVTAMMLSVSVDRGPSTLNLAVSGIWLVSLACGVASGITGITGLFISEASSRHASARVSRWLAITSEILFLVSATLFSVALCTFAFSSSQATVARVIVTIFTSTHFLALLVFLIWLVFSWQFKTPDIHTAGRTSGNWPTMRNLVQLSIRTTDYAPENVGMRDVERGLDSRASFQRPAPPTIHVTDTEQETNAAHTPSISRDIHDDNIDEPEANGRHVMEVQTIESEVQTESEHGLTSLSFSHAHANLAVPAAHRISSDSSRSLPALPSDVQIARCMSYGPNGVFLCIGNNSAEERCAIVSADSPATTLGELKLSDIARQLEWSRDGENILLRLSHMIYVWNAMPSNHARRPAIIIYQESDNVKWFPNNGTFLSCKKDIFTSFNIDGTPTGVFQIPAYSIQDFVVTKEGSRVICLISNLASTRSGKTASSTQKLVVYNLESKLVEQITPVGRDAQSLIRSTVSPDLILVNFIGNTPPQVWRYRQNTDASERRTSTTLLSFKRAMSFRAPSSLFSGYGIFGSADDKLILSFGGDGDMFVFASDSGQPLRHIRTHTSRLNDSNLRNSGGQGPETQGNPLLLGQCVAWDGDILSFVVCMGFADGSIWQWKIPFDAISQDTSTFAVMTLEDEDSTLIRASAVDRTPENGKGET